MYIIYNNDGSIKSKLINEFIQQGNSYANVLFVAIEERLPATYDINCVVKLPNGYPSQVAPATNGSLEIDGITYYGKNISLTSDQTQLAGVLKINVQAVANNVVLTTYTITLTVNEGVSPDDPILMTSTEYNELISKINGYIKVPETIRKAQSLASLGQATSWENGQAFYILSADHTTQKLYQVENGNYVETLDLNALATKTEVNAKVSKVSVNEGQVAAYTVAGSTQGYAMVTDAKNGLTIISRDANGRAKVETPAATDDIATKGYVDTQVEIYAAHYITKNAAGDAFNTLTELQEAETYYSGGVVVTLTRNDFAIVRNYNNKAARFSYQNGQWQFQYDISEFVLTQAQINALNSGITSSKVATYDGYASTIAEKSSVSVSETGSATDEVQYITIDGVEKKLAGGGGAEYTAGNGIEIANDVISVDTDVVATQTDLESYRTSANQDTIDATKEAVANKVSTWQQTPDNTHYPAEKLVKDTTDDLQSQINNLKSRGRYLANWNASTGLPTTNPSTTLPYEYRTGDYYIVGVVGDTNYKPTGSQYDGTASQTVETNVIKVLDEYVYDGTNWVLLSTAPIDLSNYVTTNTAQTISGTKVFNTIRISGASPNSISAEYGNLRIGNIYFRNNDLYKTYPSSDFSLGTSFSLFNDLYLSGSIKDGTNSVSVYQLANGVIGMPAPSSTTLTDAEYAELTNGKPHQIIGTFNNMKNPLLTNLFSRANNYWGKVTYANDNSIVTEDIFRITPTKEFSVPGASLYQLNGLTYLNKKGFPTYSRGLFSYDGTNLKWVDNGIVANTTDTTISRGLSSNITYTYSQPITSITIASFDPQPGDNNPKWHLKFVKGSSLASITYPSGATIRYGYGSVAITDLENNATYGMDIEQDLASGSYVVWLYRD